MKRIFILLSAVLFSVFYISVLCYAEEETSPSPTSHNYILVIDNSKSTTGKHSLGEATDPEGLRFDAARLVYENVLNSGAMGIHGQIGVIVFCGPDHCASYGPFDIQSDPAVLEQRIGRFFNEEAHEDQRDNFTDIRTALSTARSMLDSFEKGGSTSVILLTDGVNDLNDLADPFSHPDNIRANEDSIQIARDIHEAGADFYVVALTTKKAVENTSAFLVFINQMAASGGGLLQEDGTYSNVLLATQTDLNSKLLQMLIKAESSSESIQKILRYTPLRETFTVPYDGITDATVNITFMPEDKQFLEQITLIKPDGKRMLLWDQDGAHAADHIQLTEERSYIILAVPSPKAGEWTVEVTSRETPAPAESGSDPANSSDAPSAAAHPVLINAVIRFNHNLRLKAELPPEAEADNPAEVRVWFQSFNGTDFEDVTDSDIYAQSSAELIVYAPDSDEPFTTIQMDADTNGYTAAITPNDEGIWRIQAKVQNPFVKEETEELSFEVTKIPEVAPLGDITLEATPLLEAEDGSFYIDKNAEKITFNWTVDGETDYVRAVLLENGKAINKALRSGDSIAASRLKDGAEYRLKLTVMPKNGELAEAAPVVKSITFMTAPKAQPVGEIVVEITPQAETVNNLPCLDRTAEEWAVSWTTENEVDQSSANLYKEGDTAPLLEDLSSGGTIKKDLLEEGQTYVLQVNVIPKNGLLSDAEAQTTDYTFRLYPEPSPIEGLQLTVSGSESSDDVYAVQAKRAELTWNYESGEADHFDLAVTAPDGSAALSKTLDGSTRTYTLDMDHPGDYNVSLTAFSRYVLPGEEAVSTTASAVVRPHFPGFVEKYWPFLAGAAGLLILIVVLLLIRRSAKAPRITGTLRIKCEDPSLPFDKLLQFAPGRDGVKYNHPITDHPDLARLAGKKVYDLLKNVEVSMAVTDIAGKIPNGSESQEVVHRPNTQVIRLRAKGSRGNGPQTIYTGKYDIGKSTLSLTGADGKEYTFIISNGE